MNGTDCLSLSYTALLYLYSVYFVHLLPECDSGSIFDKILERRGLRRRLQERVEITDKTDVYTECSLVPGQIFATQKRNGTKRRKLGLVHTARVLVRMLIPYPRIWGIRNLLYIPATLYRILVRFVKNGRAIILENGVFRVSCCFPHLLLA